MRTPPRIVVPAAGMSFPLACAVAALLIAWPAPRVHAERTPQRVARVNLFYTDELLERMKRRIGRDDWARRIWRSRLQSARDWVALDLGIPKTGGGYYHDYACPHDGARLVFDARRPHEHLCPRCKRYIKGPKVDAYWVAVVHGRNIQAAATLALSAYLGGDRADAEWAKKTLLHYARHYADYPVHGRHAGRGKIFEQSLDESFHLLDAAAAYEILSRGWLSADEARTVREKLFRPAAELVRRFDFGVHNIQCWHSAFLLAAALICADPQLRDFAVASIEKNLAEGLTPDNWWFEGSPGYHFYTLMALEQFAIIAKNNGLGPHNMSRMGQMLLTPFRIAYPNLELPAINDSGRTRLGALAPLLEAAIYTLDQPELGEALAHIYESRMARRSSFEALCYGPERLPAGRSFQPKSEKLDHAGMAIIRRPRSGLYALLRYGRYQGGHDHPDRLGLILYGLGRPLAPDLGTCGYGLRLLRWYRSTVAHNTVVIDEKSQNRRASDAECVFFRDTPSYAAVALRARRLYDGVEMTRTVVVLDSALIDYFRVRSGKDHTIDWTYRNVGQLSIAGAAPVSPARPPGYGFIEDVRAYRPASPITATWVFEGGKVNVEILATDGTELFAARCPGFPGKDKMSLVLVRRRAKSADFVSVVSVGSKNREALPARIIQRSDDRVCVQLGENAQATAFELTPAGARPISPCQAPIRR